ncbi:MAG: hypothetical protein U9R19_01905 [Bacteroidota bacterium]|nr:hypothetical protein [Bacteroidota bacterium]
MQKILEKIKKIEALILGASTDGEKNAAELAKQRILDKYQGIENIRNAKEFKLMTADSWHHKLLLAICRKYGVKPYRYHRQKLSTVMIKVNEDFLDDVLWKEYTEYSDHLSKLIEEITDGLIDKINKPVDEEIVQQRQVSVKK